jgi:aromatic-L-amino-acid/L-tryptophan decarboxylase
MPNPDDRVVTLDLSDQELQRLFDGVQALVVGELSAGRQCAVFDRPPSADGVRSLLDEAWSLPREGESADAVLDRCRALLSGGRRTTASFFGYILSPPAPTGVAADLLASAANQNVTSWRSAPAATELELTTIRWIGQLVRFADDAGGLFVSGGSAANLTALLLALRAKTNVGADRRRLVVYASREAHFSVSKAAWVLGVELRVVPTDARRRLDVAALQDAIEADRAGDRHPFCVVATAGTTSTGAIDPLGEAASVAAEHELWLHVDGAYGAPAAAVPSQGGFFDGIERADSLCVDAHKWLYAPLDCSVLLVRPESSRPIVPPSEGMDYIRVLEDQPAEEFAFWDHGLELSRRFRALKVWMMFRYYGARRLVSAVAEDIELASHMAECVRRHEDLELLTEPSLSICCFRHRPRTPPGVDLDAHNKRVLRALQREGEVYLSNTTVDGAFALRACITNFRTTRGDVERTIEAVRRIGAQVLESHPARI